MSNITNRKAGRMNPSVKVALILLLNLIVAVVVPMLLDYVTKGTFELTAEIIIGFLVAITLTLAEFVFYVNHIYEAELRQTELWRNEHAVDAIIANIRAAMHNIIEEQDQSAFYYEHYKSELTTIATRLQATIARKEIVLDRHHIDATHALLAVFDAPEHKIFRATHLLWETGDAFDVTYQVYFNAWIEKMKENKVTTIRRVFVYRDVSDLQHPNARKLLAFHRGTTLPILSKLVSREKIGRFKADFNITDGVLDFGIFSNLYLYLGNVRNREQISGIFSKDPTLIKQYISCFDALWNSPASEALDRYIDQTITAEQLFDPAFLLPATTAVSEAT